MPTPEDGQEDPGLLLLLDETDQVALPDHADVEVAVGRENDAVDAAFDELLLRDLVGEHEPLAAVGRSAGIKTFDRVVNPLPLTRRRRRQHEAARTRIHHDADPVVVSQRVHEHAEAGLDERQFVGRRHRSRHVDQQHDVARGDLALIDRPGANADEQELVVRRPRALADLRGHRHRPARRRLRIREPEVVHQLLDANRIHRRQLALREEAAHVRIRRGVHVGGERRERVVRGQLELVFLNARVRFSVGERRVAARKIGAGMRLPCAASPSVPRALTFCRCRNGGVERHGLRVRSDGHRFCDAGDLHRQRQLHRAAAGRHHQLLTKRSESGQHGFDVIFPRLNAGETKTALNVGRGRRDDGGGLLERDRHTRESGTRAVDDGAFDDDARGLRYGRAGLALRRGDDEQPREESDSGDAQPARHLGPPSHPGRPTGGGD